jgi:alpha-N-arabinofuranosidase
VSGNVSGRLLCAATMNARNTFQQPDAVRPAAFAGFTARAEGLSFEQPAKSLLVVALE